MTKFGEKQRNLHQGLLKLKGDNEESKTLLGLLGTEKLGLLGTQITDDNFQANFQAN